MAEQLSPLQESAQRILDLPIESLLSRPAWGELNFREVENELRIFHGFAETVSNMKADVVPHHFLRVLQGVLNNAEQALTDINNFRITENNPEQGRRQRVDRIRGLMESFGAAGGVMALLELAGSPYGQMVRRVEQKLSSVTKASADFEKIVEDAKKDIAAAVSAQKVATSKTGVEVHAAQFEREAAELGSAGRRWLWASAGFGLASVVAAVALAIDVPQTAALGWLIQYSLTKLFVVGALAAGAVWCGSIYRAIRHQVTVNRHRMNALRTFKAFAEAAEATDVRQAILLETTRAIFSATPSGYLHATETNLDGASRAVDAIAKIGKSSG